MAKLGTACATRLLALLLLLALPAAVQAQFTFTTNNGAITITGYNGTVSTLVIPGTTNGYPVTSIETNAFADNFYLTSVTIPASVTNIGYGAFALCTSLTTITVNALNPAYSSAAGVLFNLNQTTLIQYPIGNAAASYTISNSVTSIGDEAFYDCQNLTSITIPDSVTNIGDSAFIYCYYLTSVTIPYSVISIGNYAFEDCINVTSVTISDSVTSIGEYAFEGCSSLTSVTIPASVISIGDEAFSYDTSLTAITVDALNPAYTSVAGVLFNFNQTTLIQYPAGNSGTSYTVSNSVTSIGDAAFAYCSSLTSVTIPASVTSIGEYAFEECPKLTSVYFEGNAPTGDSSVFLFDNLEVYYLPGTTGWDTTFGGSPTVLWNPQVQTNNGSFGVQNNQFGFNIIGSSNLVIVVEACTNLAKPTWLPLATNTLTGGSSHFSDPQWTNYPSRFYRFSSP
ncbi:MAG: leucine-rich repeat domain-containing protein [Verrucomicrobiota bacterium]